MSSIKPDYWGNIIYETAMGLYFDEEEARKEAWCGEVYFPLYHERTVKHLEQRLSSLQKRLDEADQLLNLRRDRDITQEVFDYRVDRYRAKHTDDKEGV